MCVVTEVLTSCWNEVSVRDEEFVAVVFLQDVGQDLQGEAFLLPGLLTPLVRVHFSVGQVRVVVFVFWKTQGGNSDELIKNICSQQTKAGFLVGQMA